MGIIQSSDIRSLLQDPELTTEIAKAVAEDAEALDSLANDIAGEIEGEMGNSPDLRKKILEAAMAKSDFKRRLAMAIVNGDDDD